MTDFENLFRKYHNRLLLFAMKFVESESDVLDIVQNVFIAVWENGKYKDREELVKSYLFAAIKNNCLNNLKHQKIVKKFKGNVALQIKEMESMHYQSGEKSLIEKESLEQINRAIDSLSSIYSEVIVLSRIEGLKNAEIADHLKLPLRTVETRIFRALLLLKEKMSQIFLYMAVF